MKCHVQERFATINNYAHFSKNFPGHLSTSTSLFFNNIEEDNICLIYNSTLQVKNVSLFNNLTSLAMNETRFLPWSTSSSLFYVLMSLMIVDLKMELFVMLCKVSISIKLSVQSVYHVLQIKQSVFGNYFWVYVWGNVN